MTTTVPGAAAPAAEAISGQAWRVLAVTSLGVFIVLLDTTTVNILSWLMQPRWLVVCRPEERRTTGVELVGDMRERPNERSAKEADRDA